MPAYNPGGGQNPNDEMFNDGPTPPKDGMEEGDKGRVTGLMPREILGPDGDKFTVGDEAVFRIVAFHDKDVEFAYASEEGKGEKEGSEPKEEPMSETAPSNDNQSMMY